MKTSHGRHGGSGGKTDKGEARNAKAEAARNTDADSLARDRNEHRAGGKTRGRL